MSISFLGGGGSAAETDRATAAELALSVALATRPVGVNYGSGAVPARTTDACPFEIWTGVASPVANMAEGDFWFGP